MSQDRRFKLIEDIEESIRPVTGLAVEIDPSSYLGRGNWDLLAWDYQTAFDALWDYAVANGGGVTLPLLMLCRQSIELNLKSAIGETTKEEPGGRHSLVRLFDTLRRTRKAAGYFQSDDDAETDRVRDTLVAFENLDKSADRFRYPMDKKRGQIYEGMSVDLERLYQAHWVITAWSFACSCEAQGHPPAPLATE